MATNEIKQHLFEGINNIDEPDFLMALKEMIDRKYTESPSPKLSELQLRKINESEAQIEAGEFFTDEQVNMIIDKWLQE
jgi:predicted transcriptional regulator